MKNKSQKIIDVILYINQLEIMEASLRKVLESPEYLTPALIESIHKILGQDKYQIAYDDLDKLLPK